MPVWAIPTISVGFLRAPLELTARLNSLLIAFVAWKLAHVLRGWARPSLLQTYETERRQYALDLIEFDKNVAESLVGMTAAHYQECVLDFFSD